MRSRGRLFALSLIIALALAHASRASSQDHPIPAGDLPGMRSPGTATVLSLAGMVVPIGIAIADADQAGNAAPWLMLGGVLAGPSLGYAYAGDIKGALKGLGLRTAVLGVTIGAVAGICSSGCDIWGETNGAADAAAVVALAGVATTLALGIRDIVRVDDGVRARNAELRRASVSVGVSYVPEARAPGVVLTLRR